MAQRRARSDFRMSDPPAGCDEFDLMVTTTPAPPMNVAMWRRAWKATTNIDVGAELLLVGDSIAASFQPSPVLEAFGVKSLHNFGVSGFRCQNVLWLLDSLVTFALRPTSILLMIGTNNFSAGDKPGAIAAGIHAILNRLATIWDPAMIVLVQTIPRGSGEELRRFDRKQLHGIMLNQAQDFPSLLLVEADPVLEGEARAYHPDGVHLLPFGYRRIAELLRNTLDKRVADLPAEHLRVSVQPKNT